MALSVKAGDYVVCPYDEVHLIEPGKYQTHIVKCRKAQPHVDYADCPFNATHRIAELEMQFHMEHCPDRKKLDQNLYAAKGSEENRFPVVNVNIDIVDNEWDNANNPTYDPKEYVTKAPVRRQLNVESMGVRRGFRMEERARLANLEDNMENRTPSTRLPQLRRPAHVLHPENANIDEPDPYQISSLLKRAQIDEKVVVAPPPNSHNSKSINNMGVGVNSTSQRNIPKGRGRARMN